MRFLKALLSTALALATLVGAYVGAAAIDAQWLFWVIVPASVAVAAAYGAWPILSKWPLRIREYERLLALNAELQSELAEVKDFSKQAEDERETLASRSRREGADLLRGAVNAVASEADLVIAGFANLPQGLVLGARTNNGKLPAIGSIYVLKLELFDQIQGVVKVVEANEERTAVLLQCIREDNKEFWEHIQVDAARNSPPKWANIANSVIHGPIPGDSRWKSLRPRLLTYWTTLLLL